MPISCNIDEPFFCFDKKAPPYPSKMDAKAAGFAGVFHAILSLIFQSVL
jgi:hypothetical protein